jgi:hypothetical protein
MKKKGKTHTFPGHIFNKREENIDKAIEELMLKIGIEQKSLLGTRNLRKNSSLAYTKHLKGLLYFSELIGDYLELHNALSDSSFNHVLSFSKS